MGKKKDKKKKGAGKEKTAAKEQKKAGKREKKRQKEEGEDDIDAILAELSVEDAERSRVVIESDTPPPSPRVHVSLSTHPSKAELLIFGGEFFDGERQLFFNDLYRYEISKDRWTLYTGGICPSPRSSHQAVTMRRGGCDELYIFGGEFANSTATQFKHFNDLWRMDLSKFEWERVELASKAGKGKGKKSSAPPARSGHRMVQWKHFLILFGGFQETFRETKYLSDVWVFDTDRRVWFDVTGMVGEGPSPRSAFQMASMADGVYIYGGFAKLCTTSRKGGEEAKPITYTDLWWLHIAHADPGSALPLAMTWERVKTKGIGVGDRGSVTMAVHKERRAIVFGGVKDLDSDQEVSVFFNDLHVLDIPKRRWFPLSVKNPQPEEEDVDIEADDAFDTINLLMPHPRFNAAVAIVTNTLYVYGGLLEILEREVTWDDLWAIDLNKKPTWRCLYEGTVERQEWKGEDEAAEEVEEEEEEEEEEDEEEEEEEEEGSSAHHISARRRTRRRDHTTPLPDETLRAYYERTVQHWTGVELKTGDGFSGKDLRRRAFLLARAKYEEKEE